MIANFLGIAVIFMRCWLNWSQAVIEGNTVSSSSLSVFCYHDCQLPGKSWQ